MFSQIRYWWPVWGAVIFILGAYCKSYAGVNCRFPKRVVNGLTCVKPSTAKPAAYAPQNRVQATFRVPSGWTVKRLVNEFGMDEEDFIMGNFGNFIERADRCTYALPRFGGKTLSLQQWCRTGLLRALGWKELSRETLPVTWMVAERWYHIHVSVHWIGYLHLEYGARFQLAGPVKVTRKIVHARNVWSFR